MPNKTVIIAEAGVNHDGELSKAISLVDAASEAGADVIKFQTFKSDELATSYAAVAEYQKGLDQSGSQLEMLRKLELSRQEYDVLFEYSKQRNIQFLSTGFDLMSLEYLSTLDMRYFKIPSGELTNLPLLRLMASYSRPVILSTGMASLGEVEAAINALENAGLKRKFVTVLQCTTEYPAAVENVNLLAMDSMRCALGVHVGLSDHTVGIEVPIAAAALGAKVIEKHITLDRKSPGPDHFSSLEPSEFKTMVASIRNIEAALGSGIKEPTQTELENRDIVRKSIVAARDIKQGEILCSDNLTTKRPGTGLNPMQWDRVLGSIAKVDFARDEQIFI